jgi:uncharacterized caspase-like protein
MIGGIFACAIALIGAAPAFAASDRVALVIGNSAYANAVKRAHSADNASDMSAMLRGIGFQVLEGRDLTKAAMVDKLDEFERSLAGAKLGLFYYSGNGLAIGMQSYLMPVDAKFETVDSVVSQAIGLNAVMSKMQAEHRMSILLIDANRDNPLARSARVGAAPSAPNLDIGTTILYATQPSNVALEGIGRNSPFTAALLKNLPSPGLEFDVVKSRVRDDVAKATDHKQIPWDSSAIMGELYLVPTPAK